MNESEIIQAFYEDINKEPEIEKNTRHWWLDQLEEPYRTQAINNTRDKQLRKNCSSMGHALGGSFTWNESPEGLNYWCDLHERY